MHIGRPESEKYAQLEFGYEAPRILAVSWEEAQDAAVEFLKMNKVESRIVIWPLTPFKCNFR